MTGVVFDVKEFAVFDGPGIRTTVFMKGCPLRCEWCHNPEGLEMKKQLMVSRASCTHCGACKAVCEKDACDACGRCVSVCRLGLRKIVGADWTADALAKKLLRGERLLRESGGGITFSGGEPLMQWDFVKEVIARLEGLHTALETCGYTTDEIFLDAMRTCSLIHMDVKQVDDALHRKYTGRGNAEILRHLKFLRDGDTPFIVRVPLIPSVNDNLEHLEGVAGRIEGAKALVGVELLPYHRTAGAKYAMLGREYAPTFDTERPVQALLAPFEARNIPVRVL
ncbi:MAG: glycyl-radical enzyme activating protein [Christensenellales bacterium]|jgi:pyruvate formate lyase activating enzyme